jgi:type I restriction enzyme R subunit
VDAKTCKVIVIDTTINSMVEFKQIIGRGTRIQEEMGKVSFTIIDFTGATELFNDPDFDGDTEIKNVDLSDKVSKIEDEESISDNISITVDENDVMPAKKRVKRPKIILPNEDVYELYRQERLIDEHGNLITESFMQFVKNKLTNEFETYTMFKKYWDSATMKENIINELENKDIYLNILEDEVGEEYDPFDLLVHVAYGKKPLTRSQRARYLKQSDYFDKYSEEAKEVITILLDKYVDYGLDALENIQTLKIPELENKYGTLMQIIMSIFLGVDNFKKMLKDLKLNLYKEA